MLFPAGRTELYIAGVRMSERLKIALVYVLICLIWGTTWFAIKFGLDSFPPFFAAGIRFAVASIVYAVIIFWKKYPLPKDKLSLKVYMFMGIFSYIIPFGLVYWSEQYIASGLASVIFAIYPFAVAIFSKMYLESEEITPTKLVGMMIGFAGIVLLFSDSLKFDKSMQFWGMLAAILNALFQSFVIVMIKKHGKNIHPVSLNFIPMLIGSIGLLLLSLFLEDSTKIHFTSPGIMTVLYLGIFGSVVTFTAYYWLLKKIHILMLSVVSFITPVVAIFTGYILLNEKLTKYQLIGSMVALAGVLVSSVPKPKFMRKYI